MIQEKAKSLYDNLKQKVKDLKPENFMSAKDGLIIFKKSFGLNNVKITGKAASANQETADKFPDTIKKIIEKGYLLEQVSNVEVIDNTPEDNLMEMSASKPVPDDEEEDIGEAVPENKLTFDSLAEEFQSFEVAFDFFYNMDPSIIMGTETKANSGRIGTS